MPRRMSVQLTQDQVRARIKTETRRHRDTWKDLRPGDRLILIEKGMGLPKGAKQVVITEVEVTANDLEPLYDITDEAVAAEGFPDWDTFRFVEFWLDSHGVPAFRSQNEAMAYEVRVIKWRYLDDGERTGG